MLLTAPTSDLKQTQVFDYMVYIGRFQPFHLAHHHVVELALQHAHNVILVLGSTQDERTIKNPFSTFERQQMILASFTEVEQQRLLFAPIIDVYNDKKWVKITKQSVLTAILNHRLQQKNEHHLTALANLKIGLIGHFKDDSSYYLALFPEWTLVGVENFYQQLSATPIREKYYQGQIDTVNLSPAVQQFLKQFQQHKLYPVLQDYAQRQDTSVIYDDVAWLE